MSEETKQGNVLEACLGRAQPLETLLGYAADAIVSKTILDKHAGTLTLFAFDKGQRFSEHTSSYDAIVQVLEGRARVVIAGWDREVNAGELIVMPANVPHAVAATEQFKMLLIMIRT